MATNAYAGGGFCSPQLRPKIPPLAETGCNASMYAIFPKITEYKGQLLEAANCLYNGGNSQSDLSVTYCKAGATAPAGAKSASQDFRLKVLDLDGPEYQSKINKSLLKIQLMVFDPSMTSPAMHIYQSSNQDIDENMARIAMPSGNGDAYAFTALHNKRYLVTLTIYGKDRFKEPKDVDAFVAEYTKALRF